LRHGRTVPMGFDTEPESHEYLEYLEREAETWVPGFIAEEVEAAGLTEFCIYDAAGNLTSVAYDRIPAALLMLAQRQQQQIDRLYQLIDPKGGV